MLPHPPIFRLSDCNRNAVLSFFFSVGLALKEAFGIIPSRQRKDIPDCNMSLVTMPRENLLVSGVLLGIVVWAAIKLFQVSHRPGPLYPLPPGPKGKPIVGNLGDLPALGALEWEHWAKHKKLYGKYAQSSGGYSKAKNWLIDPPCKHAHRPY